MPPGLLALESERLNRRRHFVHDRKTVLVPAVDHDQPVARDEPGEVRKALRDRSQVTVTIEMIFLDVQDRGGPRAEIEERLVVFAGFGDKVGSITYAAAAAQLPRFGPDHETGVEIGLLKGKRQPGGRRALAVRAADRNPVAQRHQRSEQLRILDDRDSPACRFQDLGMLRRDCGRRDQQLGLRRHTVGRLPRCNAGSRLSQPRERGRIQAVGAADARTAPQQDGGQSSHSAAADSNHVDAQVAEIARNLPSWLIDRM
jgi:hypothetical protein